MQKVPRSFLGIVVSALIVVGCTSSGSTSIPLIPDDKIVLTSGAGGSIPLSAAVGAALAYLIYDPLAPNWEIEERRLGEFRYQMSLRMKRFNTGGDGDALGIVRRRAQQLQLAQGQAGFRVTSFDQGIDSQTIGARRWAEAFVVLTPATPVPKTTPIPILVPEAAEK